MTIPRNPTCVEGRSLKALIADVVAAECACAEQYATDGRPTFRAAQRANEASKALDAELTRLRALASSSSAIREAVLEVEPTLQRLASQTWYTPHGDAGREIKDRANIARLVLNTLRAALSSSGASTERDAETRYREALEQIDAALLAFAGDCDPTQKADEQDRHSTRLVGAIARITREALHATR